MVVHAWYLKDESELSPSLPWLRPPLQMLLPAVFADYLHICMHAHSALYFIPILLIYRTLRITRSTCQQHVALYMYHTMCTHILLYTQHCNYTHLLCSTICTPPSFIPMCIQVLLLAILHATPVQFLPWRLRANCRPRANPPATMPPADHA